MDANTSNNNDRRGGGGGSGGGDQPGALSWRLSSHPITLLFFLGFRMCMFPLSPLLFGSLLLVGCPGRGGKR